MPTFTVTCSENVEFCFRNTAAVSATRLPSSSGHSCQQCQCGQEMASECIPCHQAAFCRARLLYLHPPL